MRNHHESLMRDLAGLVPYQCHCGTLTNASAKTLVVQSHYKPDATWCLISYGTLTTDALQRGQERAAAVTP